MDMAESLIDGVAGQLPPQAIANLAHCRPINSTMNKVMV